MKALLPFSLLLFLEVAGLNNAFGGNEIGEKQTVAVTVAAADGGSKPRAEAASSVPEDRCPSGFEVRISAAADGSFSCIPAATSRNTTAPAAATSGRPAARKIVQDAMIVFASDQDARKAEAAYRKALELDRGYLPAYLELGILQEAREDWAGARQSFEQVIAHARPGQFADTAREELARIDAVSKSSGTTEGRRYDDLIFQAQAFLLAGQLRPATNRAAAAQALDAKRWEAYALAADIAARSGQPAQASSFLKLAMERAPESERTKLAKRAPTTVSSTQPDAAIDARGLQELLAQKDFAKAVQSAKRLGDEYQRNPKDVNAAVKAAVAYALVGDYVDAVDTLTRFQTAAPGQRQDVAPWLDAINQRRPPVKFPYLKTRNDYVWLYTKSLPISLIDVRQEIKCFEAGYRYCAYAAGLTYEALDEDYQQALAWYQRAADLGDFLAMTKIGNLYMNGKGVPASQSRARLWYAKVVKAAREGNVEAMNALGRYTCYPCDPGKAPFWAKKAAENGQPESYFEQIKTMGIDGKKEGKLLHKFAADGYAEARHILDLYAPVQQRMQSGNANAFDDIRQEAWKQVGAVFPYFGY